MEMRDIELWDIEMRDIGKTQELEVWDIEMWDIEMRDIGKTREIEMREYENARKYLLSFCNIYIFYKCCETYKSSFEVLIKEMINHIKL